MNIDNYYFSIHGCNVEGYSLNVYKKGPDKFFPHLTSLSTMWPKPKFFNTFPEVLDELEKFEEQVSEIKRV